MLNKRFENERAAKVLVWSFVAVVAAMPFHTFFTTWLGASTGGEEVIKAWKEILIFLNFFAVLWLLKNHHKLIWQILTRPVNLLVAAYIAWHLVVWAIRRPDLDAAVAGTMVNGRFLALFVIGQVVILFVKRKAFEKLIQKVFLTGAIIVGAVGTLQALVLDKNILSHFGYSERTVLPYISLDQNEGLARINSTLRGPNPLGAYLVLPMLVLINRLKRQITPKSLYGLLFMSVTMLFTFSRSAWLGFGAAFVVYLLMVLLRYPVRLIYALTALLVGGLLVLSALTIWRDSYVLQTYVYHDDPHTGAKVTSNEAHVRSMVVAAEDVLEDPLGGGPGTAGPASRYNDDVTRIGESYYLQVGQEVGVIGLGLFLAINAVVAIQLWRRRHESWPRMLFATLVGLSVVNFFLHGWADDATALTWWAFAGLYYR